MSDDIYLDDNWLRMNDVAIKCGVPLLWLNRKDDKTNQTTTKHIRW
jgi:hypothetical protein